MLKKISTILNALERREKWMLLGGSTVLVTFMTCFAIFHEQILSWMVKVSTEYAQLKLGWLYLILLLFLVSFPPLIGYSAISTFTGMAYGFPWGWPILAAGTLFGSFLSFLTFRYILRERAVALAHKNIKFMAFSHTLEQDRFTLLWLIRLCPLPYSLSNAALSSVPSVQPWRFFVATGLTTPKLFLHIFIGDRLAKLGKSTDNSAKLVNFLSILIAVSVGIATTYLIYNRTVQKAAELEQQRGQSDYNEVNDVDELEAFDISDEETDLTERDPFPLRDTRN